ncbi:VOC family protein [uncultured Umboniibacter sp.]|uniref:VOC family protein n=1 Tax=uncultured Umboniibacter sp. TaxID=1798917 RepID=UPI00262D134F|nr:VOC family protein [uncultured Umboniibacter sp.]
MLSPFHLAVSVDSLAKAREFYGQLLECPEGRSSDRWVDFNFFGHQFVVHLDEHKQRTDVSNIVDGHGIPVPHFGVVLTMDAWNELRSSLEQQGVQFVVEPHIRFPNTAGEQGTLFIRDPSGNTLEFKGFADVEGQLFAT